MKAEGTAHYEAFPFSAIVGQERLKLALLLNAISPAIGGVLIRGEKGTAKSTAARALAALLPQIAVAAGCRFNCSPEAPFAGCPDCEGEGEGEKGQKRKGVRESERARGRVGTHSRAGELGSDRSPPNSELRTQNSQASASSLQRSAEPSPFALRLSPFVDLPIGATEDRVLGTIDLERALRDARRAFEPGLLAAAHRGILYVDEVNLLPDHLVDVLLDAAAMGRAVVEREGVSFSHPARFILIGTMNPEEGDLRPQLLDRFGLTVEIAATRDTAERVEVVRRRIAYESLPPAFARRFAAEEAALRKRIADSISRLDAVEVPDVMLQLIAEICCAFDVDGLRADIVIFKTSRALAAWNGRLVVTPEDVQIAAELALPHRRRRQPFDDPGLDRQQLAEQIARFTDERSSPREPDDAEDD